MNDPFLLLSMEEVVGGLDRARGDYTKAARGANARALAVAAFIGRHSFEFVTLWSDRLSACRMSAG
jgi:hypothetical protein